MTIKRWVEYVPQNTGFTTNSWFDTPGRASTYDGAVLLNKRNARLNNVDGCKYRVIRRTIVEEVVTAS